MFLEAFHRVLKIQHKHNRRVDVLLTTLLKISRNKEFERLLKIENGKPTHRICEINKRHKSALEMQKQSQNKVTIEVYKKWEVQSQTRHGVAYTIKKQLDSCDCKLSCMVCTHMFSRTCLDSVLHSTICKYVHLLVMEDKENLTQLYVGKTQSSTNKAMDGIDTSVYNQVTPSTHHSNIAKLKAVFHY